MLDGATSSHSASPAVRPILGATTAASLETRCAAAAGVTRSKGTRIDSSLHSKQKLFIFVIYTTVRLLSTVRMDIFAGASEWVSNSASSLLRLVLPEKLIPYTSSGPFSVISKQVESGQRNLYLRDAHKQLAPCLQEMCRLDDRFMSLENLHQPLSRICSLIEEMHARADGAQCLLLTGPKGIGKTKLLEAVTQPRIAPFLPCPDDIHIPQSSLVTIYATLSERSSTQTDTFCQFVLRKVCNELQTRRIHRRLLQYVSALRDLSNTTQYPNYDDLERVGVLPSQFYWAGSWRRSKILRTLEGRAQQWSFLRLLNYAAHASGISLLIIMDDVESLFQGSHFSKETATLWSTQMQQLTELRLPAVGLVMCASFQRAKQLFLGAPLGERFPTSYTHTFLVRNWNSSKLLHTRIRPPRWTAASLTEFILTHSVAYQEGDTQVAKSNSLRRTSASLDTVFTEDITSADARRIPLQCSLELFLTLYGQNPRQLSRMAKPLKQLKAPCEWPALIAGGDSEAIADAHQVKFAQWAFEAYVTVLVRDKPQITATQLGYDWQQFSMTETSVVLQIQHSDFFGKAEVLNRKRSAPADASQLGQEIFNAAVDRALLIKSTDGCVAACDSSVYTQFVCSQEVSPEVLCWMRHIGYAEKAELCAARTLARTPFFHGLKSSVMVGPSGKQSNHDCEGGTLSSLHVVPLAKDFSLLASRSVRLYDMSPLLSHFRLSSQPHGEAWAAIVSSASAQNISAHAVAAYVATGRTGPDILNRLRRENVCVWFKEAPDEFGGDLVGLTYSKSSKAGVIRFGINRVQVKLASQETSMLGSQSAAGSERVQEALYKLYGVRSQRELNARTLSRRSPWHHAVCESIAGLIVAAQVCTKCSMSDVGRWLSLFDDTFRRKKQAFTFNPPVIATTHVPSTSACEKVEKAGVRLLDGRQLLPFWGSLGVIGKQLGVLFAPHSTPGEGEKFDRSFDSKARVGGRKRDRALNAGSVVEPPMTGRKTQRKSRRR